MPRKILLLGATGQIGWELRRSLKPHGSILAPDRRELDLTSPLSIRQVIQAHRPVWIVNAAAWTAVDDAEGSPDIAMAVNGEAPAVLAEEARRLGALLVHYSTDYVYDGAKRSPYDETDLPNPINQYGSTKLAGDRAVQAAGCKYVILRTSWVYGARGRNFMRTMLRLAGERDRVSVVDDQIGSPTWSRWIADVTAQLLGKFALDGMAPNEIVHVAADGETTWCGFARRIFELAAIASCSVDPITTAQYNAPAPRPSYTVLSTRRLQELLGTAPLAWEDQLRRAMKDAATPYPSVTDHAILQHLLDAPPCAKASKPHAL